MWQVATLLGNRKQSIVTSWTYAMWHDAIKMKALSLQPTKLPTTTAPICDSDWSVCERFDSVWQWVHVKLTLAGLWHTPAASLGSQLCGTGLLVPVRAGCVLVGGAGRWLAGEGAGHNVEHWAKAELVYFRYKIAPVSECTGTSQHSPGCAGVSVLGTFVDVVNIIHSKLSWLHPLPARWKPLPLQRMAPMSGVCVVIDVIPPASNRPINSPARRKSRRLLPAHGRQIAQRLCWHTADC